LKHLVLLYGKNKPDNDQNCNRNKTLSCHWWQNFAIVCYLKASWFALRLLTLNFLRGLNCSTRLIIQLKVASDKPTGCAISLLVEWFTLRINGDFTNEGSVDLVGHLWNSPGSGFLVLGFRDLPMEYFTLCIVEKAILCPFSFSSFYASIGVSFSSKGIVKHPQTSTHVEITSLCKKKCVVCYWNYKILFKSWNFCCRCREKQSVRVLKKLMNHLL
jgi:hypothetical protein